MIRHLLLASLALLALPALGPSPLHAERRADHVFVISFDGGKPAVIHESEMPALKKLAADGAVTWTARTIFPPKTLPSHTSMLTGLGPDKHCVDWNNYTPIRGKVKPPSIFAVARQHDASLVTAMFPGKQKFRHLWQPGSLDLFDYNGPQVDVPLPDGQDIEKLVLPAQTVARNASAYMVSAKPNLCFIHFPDPDSAGHKSGWGSPEQKEAFKVSDQALGQIIKAIEKAGIASSTVVLISADHGGHEKTHGENTPDDMNIPWIAWGKGVKRNFTITAPVTTYDTAATALWLLDVPLPADFDGKPVTQAFEK
jgi:predicted AlkP superfamily pyrophosphatase or phosphodiesterase